MQSTAIQEKSRQLDQFYTNPVYAKTFYDRLSSKIDLNNADILLEPSAGTGNFFNLMDKNKRIGLDIDPKCNDVIYQDFLSWKPSTNNSLIYTIGNPPFGKNSNLAVKFFNHSAYFSEVIAFILPRTFRKASIINRLDENFHLIHDQTTPNNCFIYNNKKYNVWCCEQIWIKKDFKRKKIPILKLTDFVKWFEIVSPSEADFAIQRVGNDAGKIKTTNFKKYSKQSHFFVKQKYPWVLNVFLNLNFDDIKYNTSGNPSISANEILTLWKQKAKEMNFELYDSTDLFVYS